MTEAEYEWRLETFSRFLFLGPSVWTNWNDLKDRCVLGFDSPRAAGAKETALACIFFRGTTSRANSKPKATGRTVYRPMPNYELLLTTQLMNEYTGKALDKILLHELVHLGYAGHGPDFKAVCEEVGGVLYGAAANGTPGVHVEQKQPNGRFKRVKTFSTESEALKWWRDPENVKQRLADIERLMDTRGLRMEDAKKLMRARLVYGDIND